jgi:hypothetical protein
MIWPGTTPRGAVAHDRALGLGCWPHPRPPPACSPSFKLVRIYPLSLPQHVADGRHPPGPPAPPRARVQSALKAFPAVGGGAGLGQAEGRGGGGVGGEPAAGRLQAGPCPLLPPPIPPSPARPGGHGDGVRGRGRGGAAAGGAQPAGGARVCGALRGGDADGAGRGGGVWGVAWGWRSEEGARKRKGKETGDAGLGVGVHVVGSTVGVLGCRTAGPWPHACRPCAGVQAAHADAAAGAAV